MSNMLAISVALKKASIAAEIGDSVFTENADGDMPSCFVAIVDEFCRRYGLNFETNIDRLLVASGPGSFTGLRVAMSFAKAIKCVTNTVVIPINYFNVMESVAEQNNIINPTMIINSENSSEFFVKRCTESAYVKKINDIDDTNTYPDVICEAENPIIERLTKANTLIVEDLRNAERLFHAVKFVRDNRLEPFYVKPPYTCKC